MRDSHEVTEYTGTIMRMARMRRWIEGFANRRNVNQQFIINKPTLIEAADRALTKMAQMTPHVIRRDQTRQ